MALVVKKIKNNSLINNINPKETQFILQLKFPFPYNKMYNIIKNIQTFGNLISFFENKIISDPILLNGQNTYAKNTFFFLRYKQFLNLYMKVNHIIETDYFLQINYKVYKTSPKTLDFFIIFNLHNLSYSTSYMIINFIFFGVTFTSEFVNIFQKEQMKNLTKLSKAISLNKLFTFYHTMKIINTNYDFISSLCLHFNLFKFFFPSTKKLKNLTSDENNGVIYEKQRFKLSLKEKTSFERLPGNMQIHVELIQNLKTQLLIIYNLEKYDEWYEYPHHSIYFFLSKISHNQTFVSMKTIFDFPVSEEFFGNIRNYSQRLINNLEKICYQHQLKQKIKNNK